MPWTAAPREVIPVAVVQPALERDVAQRVDVAVGIAVVVEGQVVHGEPQQPRADVDVGEHRHVVDGGLGVVGRGPGVQREAQGDGGAVPHEPGGRHDMCGVEMVQRPRWSCSPQRPQVLTASKSTRNSLALRSRRRPRWSLSWLIEGGGPGAQQI